MIVAKGETATELLVTFSIPKEPLKELLLVDEVKVDDLSDEQLIEFVKEELGH